MLAATTSDIVTSPCSPSDLFGLSEKGFLEKVLGKPREGLSLLVSQLTQFLKTPGKLSQVCLVIERIRWIELEEGPDFESFRDLLLHISTLAPSSLALVFKAILLGFCGQDQAELTEDLLTRAIDLIAQITKIVPSSTTVLIPSLEYNFPHYSRPHHQLTNYVSFLVALVQRLPFLRARVLELIVEKALNIDVAIQMEAVNLSAEDVRTSSPAGSDAEDEVDLEVIDSDLLRRSSSPVALSMVDLMKKLDTILGLVFKYFSTISGDQADLKVCFDSMLQIFDRQVLPTFRSRSVPFLLFHMTSLAPELTDLFLGFLMKRLYHVFDDPMDQKKKGPAGSSTASLLTVVTASYIGSFVSRARFLPTELVRLTFDMLLTWSLRFIGDLPNHLRSATKTKAFRPSPMVSERIAVFYAVAQSIMYIFCFRHRILLSNSSVLDSSESVKKYRSYLIPILQSQLNPLKWCMKAVVEEFLRLAEHYELIDCRQMLERDSRSSVPSLRSEGDVIDLVSPVIPSSSTETGAFLGDLDCYFPFDPMILQDCATTYIVSDIFIDWSETNDLASSDEEEDDDEDNDLEEDEPDNTENIKDTPFCEITPRLHPEDEIFVAKKRLKLDCLKEDNIGSPGLDRKRALLQCNPTWRK